MTCTCTTCTCVTCCAFLYDTRNPQTRSADECKTRALTETAPHASITQCRRSNSRLHAIYAYAVQERIGTLHTTLALSLSIDASQKRAIALQQEWVGAGRRVSSRPFCEVRRVADERDRVRLRRVDQRRWPRGARGGWQQAASQTPPCRPFHNQGRLQLERHHSSELTVRHAGRARVLRANASNVARVHYGPPNRDGEAGRSSAEYDGRRRRAAPLA